MTDNDKHGRRKTSAFLFTSFSYVQKWRLVDPYNTVSAYLYVVSQFLSTMPTFDKNFMACS
jgi:uncharacterized protein YozE (UPF0346 family)